MDENRLLDEIARTLAGPMPRRQAFKHILRGLGGASLAMLFSTGRALADNRKRDDDDDDDRGNKCGKGGKACTKAQKCCGGTCVDPCPKGQDCCPAAGRCCPPHQCCGKVCCNSTEICDGGKCKRKASKSDPDDNRCHDR